MYNMYYCVLLDIMLSQTDILCIWLIICGTHIPTCNLLRGPQGHKCNVHEPDTAKQTHEVSVSCLHQPQREVHLITAIAITMFIAYKLMIRQCATSYMCQHNNKLNWFPDLNQVYETSTDCVEISALSLMFKSLVDFAGGWLV